MATTLTRIVIALTLLGAACSRPAIREYELRGQVVAVDPARQEVTIKHEDIRQFMPGMTMAFRVGEKNLLDGRIPGDLVRGTLVVRDADAYLRTLERTGFSALSEAATSPPRAATVTPGQPVADATFVDEKGTPRRLSDWRGQVVAVTFIYTRCPVPNFCPVMDRQFKTVQDRIRGDAALAGRVRLLSVSFDPASDTPSVLSKHAQRLDADPAIWQFVTGDPDDVDKFAAQFGVSIRRGTTDSEEIVHNLRTGVIDAQGRLVTILNGSEWTPSTLLEELRKARAERPLTQEAHPTPTSRSLGNE